MLEIVKMSEEHKSTVFKMVKDFYTGPGVEHDVEDEVLLSTLNAAITNDSGIDGYVLIDDNDIVGYGYVTSYFSSEMGGKNIMMEELYINENCRGKGYGKKYFEFIFNQYKDARRFRLEATRENKNAIRLYEKLGFRELMYMSMVCDK